MRGDASRFRGPAALCLAVALASGLAGCRPRTAAGHQLPAIPPATSVATDSAATDSAATDSAATDSRTAGAGAGAGAGAASGTVTNAPGQAVGQQDVEHLNGILASVGGAVTSVRSAIAGDTPAPKG